MNGELVVHEGPADLGDRDVLVETAFILDDVVIGGDDITNPLSSFYQEHTANTVEMSKSLPGSTQQQLRDLPQREVTQQDIMQPPADPKILAMLLESESTHFRCVRVKTVDSVGREWKLIKDRDVEVDEVQFVEDSAEVRTFLNGANEIAGFEGVMDKVSMDYESVGWACIEVVRNFEKKIRYLYHIPAARVRVLKGWKGFVEINPQTGQHTYYQPFGQKVLSSERKQLDGTFERYDAALDTGPIEQATWNLVDRANPNNPLGFKEIGQSANELMFIPKVHPKSIYYGLPDIMPAIGAIIGNINIRDFFLQFFEHNAVPQYAIIIKGAKLSPEVKDTIQRYFAQEVKGQSHKTLIIPIPAAGGDVEVHFEKLSAEVKEGSFQDTRKNNWNDITIAHGVNPAIIGMVDNASLGSGKGTAQQENHKNRIVDPLQKFWERKIKLLFRLGLGINTVYLDFEELDVTDKKTERENDIAYLSTAVLTVNQIRERRNLGPPVEGGDVPILIIGTMAIPLTAVTAAPGGEGTGTGTDALEKQLSLISKTVQELRDEGEPS